MVGPGTERVVLLRSRGGAQLRWADVLDLLEKNDAASTDSFPAFFAAAVRASPFDAFYFECPAVAPGSLDHPFEFVTVDKPAGFRAASSENFDRYLTKACGDRALVVAFPNLGRDAMLVVPCQAFGAPRDAYGHLANFLRLAPETQQADLWRQVAKTLRAVLDARPNGRPVWLSTEGSGVPWLHVRLDNRPKYYHTPDYIRPRNDAAAP